VAFELPTLTVEIAFDSSPTAESPSWTDVSFLLRSFSISRGRQYALGRYEAGTARIRLDNRERRFDPAFEGVIVNLITNPSFELATTGYGSEFGSITRSSSAGVPFIDSWGLSVTTTNVIYSGVRFDPTSPLSVSEGLWYTFSAYARLAVAGSKAMGIWISWFDEFDVSLADDYTPFTLNSTTYTRFQVTAVAPATAAYATLFIITDSAGLGVFDFWVDALQFEDLRAETRNLIINPSSETNSTGYSGGVAAGIVRSNAAGVPYVGSWGHIVTTTNVIDSGIQYEPTPALFVTEGLSYTFSAYIRLATAGSKAMAIWIKWLDIDDNELVENSEPFTLNSTTYARFSCSATAPSNASYVRLQILTAAAGGIFDFWTDAWQFELAESAGTYHDGDQTNGAWSGTAHASTSLYSAATVTAYADGDQHNCSWTGSDHESTTLRGGRYFGRLLPMKKIRISATYSAVIYRLFTGYIDGWPQSWPGSKDGIVEVAATDGFKVLSLVRISGFTKAVEDVYDGGLGDIRVASKGHTLATGDTITIYGVEGATEANGEWVVSVIDDDRFDLDGSTFGETYLSGGTITQFPQERAGNRIERVLDMVNWPTADRNIDQGISVIQPSGLDRVFALEHLQLVELSENGRLFMDADGTVRFVERHDPYLSSNQFTFTSAHYRDGSPVVDLDDTQLWNQITVTRAAEPVPEGRLAPRSPVPQIAEDAASQDSYFVRSMDVPGIIVPSDNEALNYAEFRLENYKAPALRISAITVSPARLPAVLWPQVLGRTIGERVTVTIPPPFGGDDISQESFIEGIDIDCAANPRHFDVVYRLSAIGISYQLYAASKAIFTVGTNSLTTGSGVLVY
jgi:hypothetical protein